MESTVSRCGRSELSLELSLASDPASALASPPMAFVFPVTGRGGGTAFLVLLLYHSRALMISCSRSARSAAMSSS